MKKGGDFLAQHELEKEAYSMQINPMGARIERLVLDGFPILVSVERGDGKKASTHPCTPIFGPETTTSFGLSQHGAMRNSLCEVKYENGRKVELWHAIDEGEYPKGITVKQTFELVDNSFQVMTFHWNNGEETAPVNFGEHLYWNAPYGWEGLEINGKDVTETVKKDGIIPLGSKTSIKIPGMPEVILGQINLPYANLWAYQDPETGLYDTHYVCIEPIQYRPEEFGTQKTMIEGASRTKAGGLTASSFSLELANPNLVISS